MRRVFVLAMLFILPTILVADVVSKNNSANRLYKKGKYQQALSRYSAALLRAPEEPILHYNLANNQYKLQDYEKALEEYGKTLAVPDKQMRAKINYNMGCTYLREGKAQESINSFIEALRLDPTDKDAKFNLELIRKLIKQNSKKQPGQGQQQQQQKNGNKDQQNKKDGKQSQEQEQQQAEEQKEQGQEQKKDISKDEADRILNALQEDEKNTQKEVKRMRMHGDRTVEKDW